MEDMFERKTDLINLTNQLQKKYELSKSVADDYFEPGMMENLDQYQGIYDENENTVTIKTELKGLRYENRTQRIDDMKVGDEVTLVRDETNAFNSNNFLVYKNNREDIGTLPAEVCNVLAPLYDSGYVYIDDARVSYIERLSQRSRYARQGIMFVKIVIKFRGI